MFIIVFVLFILVLSVCVGSDVWVQKIVQKVKDCFVVVDINYDGQFSQDEVNQGMLCLVEYFVEIDIDSNGQFFIVEIVVYIQQCCGLC